MSFQTQYKPLFRVFVYHNYHLNDGVNEFAAMSDEEKGTQLREYDYRSFLEIIPNRETGRFLSGHNMVFRFQKDHMVTGIKVDPDALQEPFIPVEATNTLTFLIRIRDPYFFNYTDYTVENDRLLYLSNVKPPTEGGNFEYLPLFAGTDLINDNHTMSPEGSEEVLNALEKREKIGLLGCIKLHMHGDPAGSDILENTGDLPATVPQFKIHFNNRKTFWKYLKPSEGFEVETLMAKPLTKNGFVTIDPDTDLAAPPPGADAYRYPNPSAYSIKTVADKTYSEIFI